ncbi:MAG: LD-carboxypeptidase [Flavobacteriaceae bacterium]|nr:MAG: LD-carboxypeptidase [Flavobacteriaceae bacterium]
MSQLPPRLSRGRAIGVFAPSSPGARLYPERFEGGLRALARFGGGEIVLPRQFERPGPLAAGSGAERSADLAELLRDNRVAAIFTTYGGWNASDMWDHFPVAELRDHPKIVVGYSDSTALLLAIHSLTGLVVYYGPAVLPQFGEHPEPFPYTLDHLERTIIDGMGTVLAPPPGWTHEMLDWSDSQWRQRSREMETDTGWSVWRQGAGSGVLFGGHLSTLNMMVGTPWLRVPDAPITLFLETCGVGASLPLVQRSLQHLRHAGVFDRTAALLFGRSPDALAEADVSLASVVLEVCSGFDFPIVGELPFGHSDPMITLPIGCEARVEADSDRTRIEILGPTAGP